MANNLIQISELNDAIQGALEEYNENIVTGLKKTTTRAAKDLVDRTKATAPVGNRTKHYRDNIAAKTLSENQFGVTKLWYVKGSDGRLSHLLNNGHALRDGGRYPGTNFIGNAVDDILAWYLTAIEEVIENG